MEKPASNLLKQLDRAIDRTEERHAARMAEEVMADVRKFGASCVWWGGGGVWWGEGEG